jgi:preprotein translocase subunit SecA
VLISSEQLLQQVQQRQQQVQRRQQQVRQQILLASTHVLKQQRQLVYVEDS